jgi:hypothetical protein
MRHADVSLIAATWELVGKLKIFRLFPALSQVLIPDLLARSR